MNRLESLPRELREYIYDLRDVILSDTATKIQKKWLKYRAPKVAAEQLRDSVYELMTTDADGLEIDVMNPHTVQVIEYVATVLSGKEERYEWTLFLSAITRGLWEDQFTGGPGARYYNRTEIALNTLRQKFGFVVHN